MPPGQGLSLFDPDSWRVTLLPLPKRFSRGSVDGFCGGHPVGRAEAARTGSAGCWWPDGKPELLVLEGRAKVMPGRASGDLIPGLWRDADSGTAGAVTWSLREGRLQGRERHEPSCESSWGTASGNGTMVGSGSAPSRPGERRVRVGLVWRDDGAPAVVTAPGDVSLFATDGTRLAGSIGGRAAWWPDAISPPVDLSPAGMPMSEVQALDGDLQVGAAWKGMRARAGLWRGTADSFVDLTPRGFQTGQVSGGTHGLQVGFVRAKEMTPNGTPGSDNRAVLWEGAADRWFDLHGLLPASKYNASSARAIAICADQVLVGGEASRYEVTHPGTRYESHVVPVAHPVLWTARLRGATSGRSDG